MPPRSDQGLLHGLFGVVGIAEYTTGLAKAARTRRLPLPTGATCFHCIDFEARRKFSVKIIR